jgi:hypothetical protein
VKEANSTIEGLKKELRLMTEDCEYYNQRGLDYGGHEGNARLGTSSPAFAVPAVEVSLQVCLMCVEW